MKYVFFHANCFDGFGAAYAAWKKFGDEAKYIPASYGKEHISDNPFQPEDEIYILDYSVSNEEFDQLAETVAKLVMLDHHKTALERFTEEAPLSPDSDGLLHATENVYVKFDMRKSGALLAWEYFHASPVPQLIQWVSDRDLWQFKLDGTKEAHAYIAAKRRDFDIWNTMMMEMETVWGRANVLGMGKLLLSQQDITVDMICKKAYTTNIAGYNVPVVNSTSHWSEVGNKLLELNPGCKFAASYGDQPDGTRMYSLRSVGDFDVALIAQKFGGGGHKNASGFRVDIDLQLPQLTLEGK